MELATRTRYPLHPVERLTARERDVLSLMAEGQSNMGIAGELGLTTRTVETYTRRIFTKLDLAENPRIHRRVLATLVHLQATA